MTASDLADRVVPAQEHGGLAMAAPRTDDDARFIPLGSGPRRDGVGPEAAIDALVRTGRVGEALSALGSLIESAEARRDPEIRLLGLIRRAHLLMDVWEHSQALQDAHAAVETLPHHHAFATRALVFRRLGHLGHAYADLTHAVQLWPTDDASLPSLAQMLHVRADILDELGRGLEAEQDRERARRHG